MIRRAAIAVLCACLSTAATAQQGADGAGVSAPSSEEAVIAETFLVDADFGAQFDLEVPAPFRINAPRREGQQIGASAKPDDIPFIKVFYTTPDEERLVFSSLQVIGMRIDMVSPPDRLRVAHSLSVDTLRLVAPDLDTARVNLQRDVVIQGLAAAELLGTFVNADGDTLVVRIVTIPHPTQAEGIVAIAVGHPQQGGIQRVDDIFRTGASLALQNVSYLWE